ncbi:MAG: alpha/beta fold hydrolase [Deltaproteobacteria bacterium]|nr:alpha/beta fold hydrolase [Deltaproteobacteria bacterium]NCP04024.1 alpha/beta fold hydrolase [Deltaproteobacteria bacterium]
MNEEISLKHCRRQGMHWVEIGQGLPLVLLHGWSMSHAVFAELAACLQNDFRLVIPDLPGHGRSETVAPSTLSAMLTRLTDVFALELREPFALLGWSLGGQLAQHWAVAEAARLRRLILLSTTPRFCAGNDWLHGLPVGALRLLRRNLQQAYFATLGHFFDEQFKTEALSPARRREILAFAVRPVGPPPLAQALESLDLLAQADLRPFSAHIQTPTLVIHGQDDVIIPHGAGDFLAAQIPGAQMLSLPATGHAPFLSHPEHLARSIRKFCYDA